jgi:intracellular sulfur oxidation DsrE/DsrF family protein
MNTRMAYEVKMDVEKLQQMIQAVKNASEAMTEGQTFRIEVAYNIDFIFTGLKPFSHPTAISRESEPLKDQRQSIQ